MNPGYAMPLVSRWRYLRWNVECRTVYGIQPFVFSGNLGNLRQRIGSRRIIVPDGRPISVWLRSISLDLRNLHLLSLQKKEKHEFPFGVVVVTIQPAISGPR